MTDEMVDELHAHGWSDPQIAEAVYDAAYSSLLATIANAWGLQPIGAWTSADDAADAVGGHDAAGDTE